MDRVWSDFFTAAQMPCNASLDLKVVAPGKPMSIDLIRNVSPYIYPIHFPE